MFKNLLQFWKGKDFLTQVLEQFKQMLDDSQIMFEAVCRRIIDNQKEEGLEEKIYSIDKSINDLERNIRKRIIEHLSVQPSVDMSTSLLLMSVVKDAERLGDYAKNLSEISRLLTAPLDKEKYTRLFGHAEDKIKALFACAKDAFIEIDENKASQAWEYEREVVRRCDSIVEHLAKSDFSVNEAVCMALMARYFKRIAAHLTNIATSVVVPLSDLDYYNDKREKNP